MKKIINGTIWYHQFSRALQTPHHTPFLVIYGVVWCCTAGNPGFDEEVLCKVRNCLNKSGVLIRIEDDKPYKYIGKGYEFQFEEPKPWQMTGESALRVRLAFLLIFEQCLKSGYRTIGSFETCADVNNKPFFTLVPYNFNKILNLDK